MISTELESGTAKAIICWPVLDKYVRTVLVFLAYISLKTPEIELATPLLSEAVRNSSAPLKR